MHNSVQRNKPKHLSTQNTTTNHRTLRHSARKRGGQILQLLSYHTGNRTTRRQTNSQSVKSQTGQLADY